MMKKTKFTSNSSRKKLFMLSVAIILVALSIVFILGKTGKIAILSDTSSVKEDGKAKTTSTTPTAQADYSGDNNRQPGNSLHENKGTSVIKDTRGNIPTNVNTNQSTTSSTGEITVYTPAPNSLIKAGQVVAGTSTLPKITYRVIDDVSGMIAMGKLNVINGKFSGTIDFDTSSKNGRIDIFATRSDGSEYSTVEIPIIFK